MHAVRSRSRCWQMPDFENSFTLTCSQWLETRHVSCCCLISVQWKEGHTHLICRLKKFSENRAWKDICFQKTLGLWKQNLWQTCSGTSTSCLFTFLTPFCSTNCAMVSKCLFSNEKGLSLLSQVSVCVDHNCRGLFRWRSKWPAGHSGDHSPDGCL